MVTKTFLSAGERNDCDAIYAIGKVVYSVVESLLVVYFRVSAQIDYSAPYLLKYSGYIQEGHNS